MRASIVLRGTLATTLATLLLGLQPSGVARAATATPAWPRVGPRLSTSGEALLRAEVAEGRLPARWLERFPEASVQAHEGGAPADAIGLARRERPGVLGLSTDRLVNDRSGDTSCSACAFRPLGQAETTIAMAGDHVLVGWNDTRGFCLGTAVQGFGWSVDGGATWTDGGDPPALPGGGRYRGDPVHGVNRKTGRFYVTGLYEGGASGSGLATLRGHFAAGTFAVDDNRQIAIGGADFLDKEWMDVDSLSGNVYVSWTNFQGAGGNQIEFQRLDADLNPIGGRQVLSSPAANGLVQGSRPCVGPDGALAVVWYEYGFPLSAIRMRRSSDFGATFLAEETVATFYENGYNGAPGYRRGFAPTLPGIACDATTGPHRGRIYVSWDETLNFYDAPFPGSGAAVSAENDGYFASANPFTVGNVLRGVASGTSDLDLYRFSLAAGQTFVLRTDSLATGVSLSARVVCPADTASTATYRYLAFNSGPAPALCWTVPVTGVYYLRISPNTSTAGAYVLNTTVDAAGAGDRARANRDHFVASSDAPGSWTTPSRVNDNAPRFDGIFPEVAVDGRGRVHVSWHDFRDDAACGAESFEYGTSSGDGGVTWGPNRPVSDASSFWSFEACGSANQGDYQGITAQGDRVGIAWADSRLGDPDVWTDVSDHRVSLVCPAALTLAPGADTTLTVTIRNDGSVFENFPWNVSDAAGWITSVSPGASGLAALAGGGTLPLLVTIEAPSDCSGSPDTVFVGAGNVWIPGDSAACAVVVTCTGSVDVEPAARVHAPRFDLPRPNPGTGSVALRFLLARPGPARLAIYSVSGARVRTLVEGTLPAGPTETAWDGRDGAGRLLPAGTYFARLEADGRRLSRTLIRTP